MRFTLINIQITKMKSNMKELVNGNALSSLFTTFNHKFFLQIKVEFIINCYFLFFKKYF